LAKTKNLRKRKAWKEARIKRKEEQRERAAAQNLPSPAGGFAMRRYNTR